MKTFILLSASLFSVFAQAGMHTTCTAGATIAGVAATVTYESSSFSPCLGPCPGAPEFPPRVTIQYADGREGKESSWDNVVTVDEATAQRETEYAVHQLIDSKGRAIKPTGWNVTRTYTKEETYTGTVHSAILPAEGVRAGCSHSVTAATLAEAKRN
jgi:hypothetical protein